MKNLRKYFLEFVTILLSITAAFSLDLWRDAMNEREETQKALNFIKIDLQRDVCLRSINFVGERKGPTSGKIPSEGYCKRH